ncbi:MAG: DUF1592 domain-containing protein [Opitutaceae bacterium]|nr:DUF1592 domain-containing protein [Opitutaceae bacterium]
MVRGAAVLAWVFACGVAPVRAAAPAPDGARLYRQQCADCHGERGEGVKGKRAEPLTGDWTIAKLARYVAANMPDDNPGTLSAAESEAVSRHLHDAFYSREAQARLNPPRLELARLTNEQYVIAVADLLRSLSGGADVAGEEARGLSAVYFSAAQRGRFDTSKIAHRGVDATVVFTFTPGQAAHDRVGTAELSAQWRGSVFADETGDYEFVVRTPNTVRFWINTELDALNPADARLDVNVSTPRQPDHRVTVRLLGGRRYPLAIDFWALPGKADEPPPAIALRWKPPHGSERPIPARNLSSARPRPTYVLGTRFPADDSSLGYARGVTISKAWDEATTSAAFEVANHVGRHVDRLAGTRAGDAGRAQRIEELAARFVTGAFRRPLAAEERRVFVTERFASAGDPESALKRVVLLTLKSPQFLYPEIPAGRPDSHRIAARLALGLWDSLPDAALNEAAAAGALGNREAVSAQARRMLGDGRTRAKLREFFQHWLELRYVEDVGKDPGLYPDFNADIIDDLRASLLDFVEGVVWSEASDFRELLRAEYLPLNRRLATFYGLPAPEGDEFVRVPAAAGERSGVLTHPYVLAALSYRRTTSPIHRGVFLTRNIVGRTLKSPPIAVAFDDAEFTPDMTMREKVTKLTRPESCQGCHDVINPLGFSLEGFDAVGRVRREENGRAVDVSSEFISEDERPLRLTGPRDVAAHALASERSLEAFVERLFQHVVKQPILAYGPRTVTTLRESFVASGYHLQKLLVEIVTLAALQGSQPPTATTTQPEGNRS